MQTRNYDAAQTTRYTQQHFLYADSRDADALIRADLATLRNRARYEIRNNSYAKGIVETKANDLIGTGPRLQVITNDQDLNKRIEFLFSQWCKICDAEGRMTFNDIMQLAGSKQQDESGEAFIIFENAKSGDNWVREGPQVRLRLRLVEPDRVTNPGFASYNEKLHDGIEFNDEGHPTLYYILKQHPGSDYNFNLGFDYEKVSASQVIHLYRKDRPGQSRGVPWITPAIPLFAQLRRFTLATVEGAETAAKLSAILTQEKSNETFNQDYTETEVEDYDEVEIPRGSMLTMPAGSQLSQFKPEQPPSTYKDFKREILNEIARCLNMPFNVAAANSSEYNYASGRLDWQVYFRMIRTVRAWLTEHALDRIFLGWLKEAMLIREFRIPPLDTDLLNLKWFWPGSEHVDPVKEAKAQEIRLKNWTTNLAEEGAREGKDWEIELEQKKREIDKLKELGLLRDEDVPIYLGLVSKVAIPGGNGNGD